MSEAGIFAALLDLCGVEQPKNAILARTHKGENIVVVNAPQWHVTFKYETGELQLCTVNGPAGQEVIFGRYALECQAKLGGLN